MVQSPQEQASFTTGLFSLLAEPQVLSVVGEDAKCVRNRRPLSICTGEHSCLWAEGTSSNTKLHHQPHVYTTTERFYLPPLLHTQPNASIQKTNTFVAVFNRAFSEGGGCGSVERWVEVTAEWALSAGRAECRHRPSLSTAKGFLRAENQCGSEAAWACQQGNNRTTLFL